MYYIIFIACLSIDVGVWNKLMPCSKIYVLRSLSKQRIHSTDQVGDRSSHQRCSIKKSVLKNFTKFTGKHLCQSLFCRPQAWNFIIKETLAQVFSSEFYETFKNTFFTENLRATASEVICLNHLAAHLQ